MKPWSPADAKREFIVRKNPKQYARNRTHRRRDPTKDSRRKLTPEQVLEIRRRAATESSAALAVEFSVHKVTIRNIKEGFAWKRI